MNTSDCCETIRALVEPLLDQQGLILWGIELVNTGKQCLRVYIDTPHAPKSGDTEPTSDFYAADPLVGPASAALNQCELIARDLGAALDVEDLFPESWVLEVSTPGLDRTFFTLDQMRAYVGDVVQVKLRERYPAENGSASWRGILRAVLDDSFELTPVTITAEDCVIVSPACVPLTIPWSIVQRVHRRALFPKPTKPGKARTKRA